MKYRALASTDPAEDRDFQTFGDDFAVVKAWAVAKAASSKHSVAVFKTVEELVLTVGPPILESPQ